MLVLTRKLGETIIIDDNIVIKVVDIHGKQIRLGIEAPMEIGIYRGEIYEKILAEKKNEIDAKNNSEENNKNSNDSSWILFGLKNSDIRATFLN